jgi:hypothetical protein
MYHASVERPPIPSCLKCGYPLPGLKEAKCPECGTPFDARRSFTWGHNTIVDRLVYRLEQSPTILHYLAVTLAVLVTGLALTPPGHFRWLSLAAVASWIVVAGLALGTLLGRRSRRSACVWFIGFLFGSVVLVVWMIHTDAPTSIAFRLSQPAFDRLVTKLSTPGKNIRPPFRVGLFKLDSGPWYLNQYDLRAFCVCSDELKSSRFIVFVPEWR